MIMIEIGINGIKETIVTEADTAKRLLSGQLPVYATPALIAFIEYTCEESVRYCLEPGTGTVGTKLDVKHLAASPIGAHIRCESTLCEIDRRRLVFSVKVYDDFELVGEGTHERFIINEEQFMAKVNAKLNRP